MSANEQRILDALEARGHLHEGERELFASDPAFAKAMRGTLAWQAAALGVAMSDAGLDGKAAADRIFARVARLRDEGLARFFRS